MCPLPDAAVDLLLGGRCVGCDRSGRVLCARCRATLPDEAWERWPSPPPAGLVPPFSTAAYDGVVRAMVVGHKEHGLVGLRPVLADLLAVAVTAAYVDAAVRPGTRVLMVPVPSRRASVRERGDDPTRAITVGAARVLRGAGARVEVPRLLRMRPGVVDQAGLDSEQRRANLSGSMACDQASLRRLARGRGAVHVIVCDDVLTTGSTAREAQRALEAVGLPVLAVASVAATARRGPAPAIRHSESSAAILSPRGGRV